MLYIINLEILINKCVVVYTGFVELNGIFKFYLYFHHDVTKNVEINTR